MRFVFIKLFRIVLLAGWLVVGFGLVALVGIDGSAQSYIPWVVFSSWLSLPLYFLNKASMHFPPLWINLASIGFIIAYYVAITNIRMRVRFPYLIAVLSHFVGTTLSFAVFGLHLGYNIQSEPGLIELAMLLCYFLVDARLALYLQRQKALGLQTARKATTSNFG